MPIYNYECPNCGHKVETINFRHIKEHPCDVCKGLMKLVPSVPGYRRDHTIHDT